MFIQRDHHAFVFRAVAFSPDRPKGNEKTLLGSETIDESSVLSGEGFFQSSERDSESAKIGDAFTQNKLAIFVKVALNGIGIELFDDALCPGFEILGVFGCPPIAQITVGVELSALIVKTVSHLMADSGADAAVIESIIRLGVKEGVLKNAGGKNDFVKLGIVIGVHSGGSHAPFAVVHGRADLGKIAVEFKRIAPKEVQHVRAAVNGERGVITPLIGVSDLEGDRVELNDGLLACGGAHPG